MLTPYVNTEAKMPKKMFDALCAFEWVTCAKGVTEVERQSVIEFLREKHGQQLADAFRDEFLLRVGEPQASATASRQ